MAQSLVLAENKLANAIDVHEWAPLPAINWSKLNVIASIEFRKADHVNRGNGLPVKTRVPGLEPEFDETCGIFEDMMEHPNTAVLRYPERNPKFLVLTFHEMKKLHLMDIFSPLIKPLLNPGTIEVCITEPRDHWALREDFTPFLEPTPGCPSVDAPTTYGFLQVEDVTVFDQSSCSGVETMPASGVVAGGRQKIRLHPEDPLRINPEILRRIGTC
ncbi:Tnf Receptor-Associated Factor 2 [Manis pentadactyla]|nr:Tnf Receptor-Associated Factor 2 [Manis pentadactyla]